MTLSMPEHPALWERTLPKPTALLSGAGHEHFARRGSSFLPCQASSATYVDNGLIELNGRRSTVPYVSFRSRSRGSPQLGQGSVVEEKQLDVQAETGPSLLIRKRTASIMAEEHASNSSSPTSTSATESANHYCLCQPEAKIPRPRNGESNIVIRFSNV